MTPDIFVMYGEKQFVLMVSATRKANEIVNSLERVAADESLSIDFGTSPLARFCNDKEVRFEAECSPENFLLEGGDGIYLTKTEESANEARDYFSTKFGGRGYSIIKEEI